MRKFNNLDQSALKAFYFAASELNFTRAAEKAHLTQSGISQHIKKIEQEFNVELFIRHGKKIRLSPAGKELLIYVEESLDQFEQLTERFQKQQSALSGQVRYAMPDSCLFSPHFPLLLKNLQADFPQVSLQVEVCDSKQVVERLLDGDIDFGFITKNQQHKELQLMPFVAEEYLLISANKHDLSFKNLSEFKQLNFISYPDSEDLFSFWVQNEFGRGTDLEISQMTISGRISSISGAIKMAEGGLGVGIFQRHCVESLLTEKRLFSYRSKKNNVENNIFIVTVKNRKNTARVEKVIEIFLSMR